MSVTYIVDSASIDGMTLDKLQEFIDACRSVGMTGEDEIRLIGKSEGYHFAGNHRFTPQAVRAGSTPE